MTREAGERGFDVLLGCKWEYSFDAPLERDCLLFRLSLYPSVDARLSLKKHPCLDFLLDYHIFYRYPMEDGL